MKQFLVFISLFAAFSLSGQHEMMTEEEQDVYDVVVRLFDGMRAGDSSMVHSVFHNDLTMYSNHVDSEGKMHIKEGALQGFLTAVGTPHEEIWDEKIWNTDVKVEMGVAQVWTEYAFYRGTEFSHCGIDAFQMVKNDDKWKIIQLIDTRKKINCEKPK